MTVDFAHPDLFLRRVLDVMADVLPNNAFANFYLVNSKFDY